MKDSRFVFGYVHALFCNCHKISLNRGRSYIDSAQWSNDKKNTINPKHDDDMRFKYAVAAALNREKIGTNLQRILGIESFIDRNNWREINFPAGRKDWKK